MYSVCNKVMVIRLLTQKQTPKFGFCHLFCSWQVCHIETNYYSFHFISFVVLPPRKDRS